MDFDKCERKAEEDITISEVLDHARGSIALGIFIPEKSEESFKSAKKHIEFAIPRVEAMDKELAKELGELTSTLETDPFGAIKGMDSARKKYKRVLLKEFTRCARSCARGVIKE